MVTAYCNTFSLEASVRVLNLVILLRQTGCRLNTLEWQGSASLVILRG